MQWGAVVVWWLAWLALYGAGLPLAASLFPRTRRAALAAALPLSIVFLLLIVHWVGQIAYGPLTAALGALALGITAIAAARRPGVDIDRRAALELVAVFTVAFLFLIAIRSVDAGAIPGGGEKFLDFGLVQSLLRAEYLPPADHWWAGNRVLYYYGGHLVAATLALLTGTPGRLAYNLALAGFYAAAVTTVYGFGAALAADRNLAPRFAGGTAAFLFGFASNLYTLAGAVATYLVPSAIDDLAIATGHDPGAVLVTIDAFSYWYSSRVIPGVITEFPLFAYLNGDLHAHMTDTSILLLVALLGYAYYRTPATAHSRRRRLLFGILPPVIGVLTLVNTWSLPAGLGLTWLAVTFAPASPSTILSGQSRDAPSSTVGAWVAELRRSLVAALLVVPVAALAIVWVAPFILNVMIAGAADRGLGILPARTGVVAFLIAHGGFLLVFAAALAGYLPGCNRRRIQRVTGVWVVLAAATLVVGFPALAMVGPLGAGAWYLHRRGHRTDRARRARPGYEALLLVAGAGLVLLVELIYVRDAASPGRFNTVFKVYAQVWPLWSVAGGVALADILDAPSRTRTPAWVPGRRTRLVGIAALLSGLSLYGILALFEHFHPYAVIWIDWLPLIVGGFAVIVVTAGALLDSAADRSVLPVKWVQDLGDHPVLVVALTALLVFHGAIAVTADDASVPAAEPTLDAIAFVHTWHPGEAPAIEWLLDRPGQPYVVAAPGRNVYGWSSEAASLTGLPTVAGWATEAIYRGGDAYSERANDVDLLFTGPPQLRAALLDKYDVTYIYVGPNERSRYGSADLAFADEPGIAVAYRRRAVTIYVVNQSTVLTA
ncbi:MAG: DUF2298 domain-containing protein [Halobacteriaceae archaeon]